MVWQTGTLHRRLGDRHAPRWLLCTSHTARRASRQAGAACRDRSDAKSLVRIDTVLLRDEADQLLFLALGVPCHPDFLADLLQVCDLGSGPRTVCISNASPGKRIGMYLSSLLCSRF